MALVLDILLRLFRVALPLKHSFTAQGILELRDAIGRISMDVRPQETQHLPTLGLELVGLPGVMNTLDG